MTTATARLLPAGAASGLGWEPRTRRAAQPGLQPGRRHGPPLPSMHRPQAAGPDIPADRTRSGLQAEAAPDDLLHDLGGAAATLQHL